MSKIFDDEELEVQEEDQTDNDGLDYAHSYLKNEAVKRISKAKLLESLLTATFFEDEMVEDSIKKEVEREIKNFIVSRLEETLGIKSAPEQTQRMQTLVIKEKSAVTLTNEEMAALKIMAKRITAGSTNSQTRSPIQKVGKKQPTQPDERTKEKSRVSTRVESELNKSSNVSKTTGQNYAQVNNPDRIPQPSQDVVNQLMQLQATKAFSSFSAGIGQDSQLMSAAITLAQQKNKNVREE